MRFWAMLRFAAAFAMQMGWLPDMLGFGQDDDDDVAVKNQINQIRRRENTNYTASDYASEQVGTSGNDTLGTSTSTGLLRYLA